MLAGNPDPHRFVMGGDRRSALGDLRSPSSRAQRAASRQLLRIFVGPEVQASGELQLFVVTHQLNGARYFRRQNFMHLSYSILHVGSGDGSHDDLLIATAGVRRTHH